MDPQQNLSLCVRSLRAVVEEGDVEKIKVAERLVDEYVLHHPQGISAIGVLDHAVDDIQTRDGSRESDVWFRIKDYIAEKRRKASSQA